jgi:acetyl-CoA synthetase
MSTDERVSELLAEYGSPDANAAELLCDRHPADAVAFTVIEPDLSATDLTYGELRRESARFAAALADLGVGPGDAVAVLMGKSRELVVALLGIWRRGAVQVPLFTAFATPAIALRLTASKAAVVVVDADQLPKLAPGPDLPADAVRHVVVVGGAPEEGQSSFAELLAAHAGADDPSVAVGSDGPLLLLFTSGTTGTPKGVPVPVKALASFSAYLEFGLDVTADDVFWNAADPGWAYGLYYAILGPLARGTRSLLLHAGFSASLSWQVMQRFGVTNFAAAPTVYRALRADPTPVPAGVRLRRASSAGEPLTPRSSPGRRRSWAYRSATTTGRPSSAWSSSTAGPTTSGRRCGPAPWAHRCRAGRPRCSTTSRRPSCRPGSSVGSRCGCPTARCSGSPATSTPRTGPPSGSPTGRPGTSPETPGPSTRTAGSTSPRATTT